MKSSGRARGAPVHGNPQLFVQGLDERHCEPALRRERLGGAAGTHAPPSTGKNGFWNADGTRMFHNDGRGNQILDTTTGAVVRRCRATSGPGKAPVLSYRRHSRLRDRRPVPADLIARVLKDKPAIRGLAVPGMPAGSPGMEGPKAERYDVLSFDKQGRIAIYARR